MPEVQGNTVSCPTCGERCEFIGESSTDLFHCTACGTIADDKGNVVSVPVWSKERMQASEKG